MMASESDLEERVRAAFQDKLKMMKIPEKDDDFLPSACCLLEKRRELASVEENLSARKEEFQMKMEDLQHRHQELEQKKAQLREAVLKFDKFLKDNDAKRHRALRKASQEHQQVAQRETEVARLRQEIARLTAIKAKLQQCLSGYRIFPEYLQKVLEKMEQFQEIPELIGQFQTLMATQATLVQRELAGREAVEEARAHLRAYVEESSNQLLQQNNYVAELQSRLEQARTRVLAGESNWICIQNTAAEKTLELGRIKLAVLNLFQMVAKYRKLPANVPQDDTEAQLEAVQLCIEDLMDILSNFRKEETTTILPSERQAGPQSEPEPSWHPSLSVDLWKDTESSSQRSQRSRVT